MEIFSIRWQVPHSKVRSSKPRSPGEIRANPILCLQVRHIGRSIMDDIRIRPTPTEIIWVSADSGLSGSRLLAKIWRKRSGVSGFRNREEDLARVTGPGGTGPALALEASPFGPGSCLGREGSTALSCR
jgi:hypothetical protein